ncbi:hypothetical protein C7974DRAFT_380553 [Boeremia exigua]|uniref:uncharacterized protein n=1 Tax=Boeremia exigua TaxID=749465 RepID=UPI001E8D369E|nr:uncharacterized protein C7974DRAFT_380553 [Boeremia exigua]KAH6614195.1 hypothetical protein C7974DRAFT_380553 [Boeremia exigua]
MVASQDALAELTRCLDTSTLLDLARRFSETYTSLAKTSTEHFLTTPLTALPDGKEQGTFLAIDVGGSNLRVGFVELTGGTTADQGNDEVEDATSTRIRRSHDKSWPIGDHLKMDQPEDLFGWIGDCMAEVIREAIDCTSIPADRDILLGVTFSFPMAQTHLSEATLLPMGKGFAIASNLNLGEMLLTGYARHCTESTPNGALDNPTTLPKIEVTAITNDTVATFVSLSYAINPTPHSRVAMGLIVGTGTNATVPMRPHTLHPSKQHQIPAHPSPKTVVINTEWTIRGTDSPLTALNLKTKWDKTLDAASDAPGFQPFEYMTSGRYLGEIVRLAFLDTLGDSDHADNADNADAGSAGPLSVPEALTHRHALPTHFLAATVARADPQLPETLRAQFPSPDAFFWTPARVRLLCDLARAVQRRSSALIAAACLGLLSCVGEIDLEAPDLEAPATNGTANGTRIGEERDEEEELVIAYTGGTIAGYPAYVKDCQAWIDGVLGECAAGKRVVLREAVDGGIVGAGVLAGMGSRGA